MDNHIFTYTFKDDLGSDYTLQFIPGITGSPLSSPASVEFPFGAIERNLNLKSSFLDDIPLGVEQAKTLEIDCDLNRIAGTFSGVDFDDVQKAVLRGGSSDIANIQIIDFGFNTHDYYYRLPNRWRLLKGTTLIFDGFQDYSPSNELEINVKSKHCKFEITCVDVMTWLLKNTNMQQLYYCIDPSDYVNTDVLYYYLHQKTGQKPARVFRKKNGFFFQHSLYNLYKSITTLASWFTGGLMRNYQASTMYIANKIVRDFELENDFGNEYIGDTDGLLIGMLVSGSGVPANTYITDIYFDGGYRFKTNNDNISGAGVRTLTIDDYQVPQGAGLHSKQKTTATNTFEKGVNVTPRDTYYTATTDGNEFGCFGESQTNLLKYQSVLDFLNDEFRACGVKGIINYQTISSIQVPHLSIYKMLDYTNNNSLLSTNVIEADYKITTNASVKAKVTSNINVVERSPNEFVSSSLIGSDSDNSYELKPFFDCCMIGIPKGTQYTNSINYDYSLETGHAHKLMSSNTSGSQLLLHPHVNWDIGKNIKVGNYTPTTVAPLQDEYQNEYHKWLNNETSFFGTQRLADVLLYTFNGFNGLASTAPKNIILIECKVNEEFDILDCGDNVSIDMETFDTGSVVLDMYGSNGIITSVEQDIIKAESILKVWIYG